MTPPRSRSLRRVPYARVAGPALWVAAALRVTRWDAILRDPRRLRRAQEETLLAHVRAAARTELGREHGFADIRGYHDFARRLPVCTYADLEPQLERMRRGARDVLSPGFVRYWGQSSGTSHTAAKHKLLPLSRAQIRWQQRASFDVVARYVTLYGDRGFPGGYTLGLFPPSTLEKVGPVEVASNPGIMQLHLPRAARRLQLPRVPIRDIPDYQPKLEAMADAYLDHDVVSLAGTTCWFSVFFDHLLAAARRRGRRPRCVADVWPNLRVLFGGGVTAAPYRPLIEGRVGRPVALIDSYSASEGGFFAVSDSRGAHDGDAAMAMIPDRGVFFELVPRGGGPSDAVPLWEATAGVDYAVLLTTSSGLFRYDIGDTVRFAETFPHRVRFVGRAAGVLSLTQELTTAGEIERAVAHAAEVARCTSVDFAASPEVGVDGTAKGRYLLFVELEERDVDLAAFGAAFDASLADQNRVYREHRAGDAGILAPRVLPLRAGATARFMRERGQRSFQEKFPRIVGPADRDRLRALAQD